MGKYIWCFSFSCLSRKSFRTFISHLCLIQPFSWNASAYPTLQSQLYLILILIILWSKFWWKPGVPVAEIPGGQSPLSSSFPGFRSEGKKNISQADLQQHSDKNHIWAIFCTKSQLLLDKPHLKSCNFSSTIKQDKIPVLFSTEPVISVRSDYKYYSSQTWYGLIRSCYVTPDYFSLFLVKFCCKTLHIASSQRKLFCQSGYFL